MKKILLTSLVLTCLPLSLYARDPKTSAQVSEAEVKITTAASNESTKKDTAYIGISECKTLITNAQSAGAIFSLAFDPLVDTDVIDDYFHFSQERGGTLAIDCAKETCTTIDSDDVSAPTKNVEVSILFSDLIEVETAEGCDGFDREFFIRMTTQVDAVISPNDVRFIVDTIRPPAPSGLTASATEGTINIEFVPDTDASDVDEFTVYYGNEVLVAGEVAPNSASKYTVNSDETVASFTAALDAGETLYVGIASNDESDNRSVLSNVVETSVVETEDYWETYKAAGGKEEGCSSTKGNSSWLLIFFGFLFLSGRRRKTKTSKHKRLVSFITISTLLLFSTNVFAETEIWGSLEIKAGGIFPAIDGEHGGVGPYASTFDNESILVGELELDVHLIIDPIVLIGAGLHWGYGSVTGPAKTADGSITEDTTSLSIMPFRLSAVARLTYLVTEFNIPFVPSLKFGLDAYRWSISDASGDTASVNGVDGNGWKPGWHAAAGLHFLLNFLAPGMASNFDFQWGVNRSYLFAEYMVTSVDGFGAEGFDFSDNYWNFGLAFDF